MGICSSSEIDDGLPSESIQNNMISEWRNRSLDKYYEKVKALGEGSMGAVCIVKKKRATAGGSAYSGSEHKKVLSDPFHRKKCEVATDVDKHYAMKSIRLGSIENKIYLNELRNEIAILKTLDHPNIVKAYEVFETKKNIHIIMELCTGGDLYARNPYSEKDAAKYTAKLLSAISFLHSHDVVHRDLKFENIMFESKAPDAGIKLIDFGLSKKFMPNSDGNMTESVGTMYTVAPQVLQGVYTSQADLWSIGVIAYMLLSRQKPFFHISRRHHIDKIMRCDYNFNGPGWRHVSSEAKKFVSSLLVLDPKERLTAEEALQHRWLDSNYKLSDRRPSESLMRGVEGGIVDYGNTGEFKKMALMVVAHKSSTEEIAELRAVFDQYDSSNDGTITLAEFKLALSKSDYTEEEVEKMFGELDVGRNGKIYYTEFIAATLEVCGRIEEDRLAEAFDKIDDDDTGYITGKNLKRLLGKDYTPEKVNQLLEEADENKDGKISFDEFLRMFREKNNSLRMDVLEGTESEADQSTLLDINAKIPGGIEDVSEG